jgi:hypothetical protein
LIARISFLKLHVNPVDDSSIIRAASKSYAIDLRPVHIFAAEALK